VVRFMKLVEWYYDKSVNVHAPYWRSLSKRAALPSVLPTSFQDKHCSPSDWEIPVRVLASIEQQMLLPNRMLATLVASAKAIFSAVTRRAPLSRTPSLLSLPPPPWPLRLSVPPLPLWFFHSSSSLPQLSPSPLPPHASSRHSSSLPHALFHRGIAVSLRRSPRSTRRRPASRLSSPATTSSRSDPCPRAHVGCTHGPSLRFSGAIFVAAQIHVFCVSRARLKEPVVLLSYLQAIADPGPPTTPLVAPLPYGEGHSRNPQMK